MSKSTPEQSVVATYASHLSAEEGLKALQQAGLQMNQFSIVGKGFHTEEHPLGFYSAGDRVKVWGGQGAFWGSLWGMLLGGAFLFLPVVGPIVVMGPLSAALVGALEGAVVGGSLGTLGAALASIGIPKDSVVKYELEVKVGRYLVLGRGDADFIERARAVLRGSGASQVTGHAAAAIGSPS